MIITLKIHTVKIVDKYAQTIFEISINIFYA